MKIIRAIIDFLRSSKARKGRQRALAALMAVVVFCTTYTLILPAITLDNQTAETEPGIEVEKSAEETLSDVQEADLLLKGQNADDADAADAGDSDSLVVESADEPAETEATVSSSENEAADTEQAATPDDAADVTVEESAQDTEEETQEVYASSPLIYHCDEYDIELSFDSDEWQLPEGTQLSVKELRKDAEEDSEEYRDYHYYDDRAKEELSDQDEELADRAYALHYYELELKADGEELSMPEGKADVTIKYNPEDKSDYNAKEFGDEETVLASLFWLSDWHTNLFDENDDESKIYTIKDHQLKKIQIKDVEMSDFDNVIGLFACPPEKKVTLKAEGSDYSVTAVCGQKSKVPEDAKLTVSEIKPGSKEFDQYLNSAREALGEEKENNVPAEHARFFDIKIMVDGEEFTPEAEIDVKINFHEPIVVEQMQDVNAVHFGEEGTEVLDAKTEEGKDGIENVSFSADSFSVYGVVYTVDFEYTVNGKVYQFSFPGGGFVSLEKLVAVLGITGDKNTKENTSEIADETGENIEEKTTKEDEEEKNIDTDANAALTLSNVEVSAATKKFVADVKSVEFSNPKLVDVSKVEADTTVGEIKKKRGLECQYSAALSEKQIETINAAIVESGDWALVSLQPFTSEESLMVTMKTGEVFTVKVMDAVQETPVQNPTPITTADTYAQGVKMWIFDYDTDGNLDDSSNKIKLGNPHTGEQGFNNNTLASDGINSYSGLKFLGWGSDSDYNITNNVDINNFTGLDENSGNKIKAIQGIVQNTLVDDYPALNSSYKSTSLAYLFDPKAQTADRIVYGGEDGNVTGLFRLENGFYRFDSNQNYAEFDQDHTFTLYDQTIPQTDKNGNKHNPTRAVGFFPFNSYENMYDMWDVNYKDYSTAPWIYHDYRHILYLNPDRDKTYINQNNVPDLNHHFGVMMEADFVLPADGKDENGQPIVYDFSGDDDMWVFIDDELVLDIGGIHQPVSGTIDFMNGTATIKGNHTLSGHSDNEGTAAVAVAHGASTTRNSTGDGVFRFYDDSVVGSKIQLGDGKVHTLKVFYLERGGCDSNCKITFNLPLVLGKGSAKIVKKDCATEELLPGATFELHKEPDCSDDAIMTQTSGSEGSAKGCVLFDEIVLTANDNTYYLKETHAPTGYKENTKIYRVVPRREGNGYAKDGNGKVIFDIYDGEQLLGAIQQEPFDQFVIKNTQTVDVSATKTWADGNPKNLTVYFKLYRTVDSDEVTDIVSVPNAEIKAVTANSLTVEWKDLDKYDENGKEYIYSVEEVDAQGNLFNPEGYHDVHTGSLAITNTKPDTYDPTTNFLGTKEWVDNSNEYGTRPENLTVTLYSHNKPKAYNGVTWTQTTLDGERVWVSNYVCNKWNDKDKDTWKFVFEGLPVFNADGDPIDYFAVETLPEGYQKIVENTEVSYKYGDFNVLERHTPNNRESFTLSDALNIGFMAVKYDGNGLLIWSPRKLSDTEKNRIFSYLVAHGFGEFNGKPERVTYSADNPHNLLLPYSFVTKKGTINISMSGNDINLDFKTDNGSNASKVWEYFTIGELKTTYTPGRTDITNSLTEIPFSFVKEWVGESGEKEDWSGDITVKIARDYTDKSGQKHTEEVGRYSIKKDPNADNGILITGPDTQRLELISSENKQYVFKTSNLPMFKEDGENRYQYNYYVSEMSLPEFYRAVYYKKDGTQQLSMISFTDNGGKIVNEFCAFELPSTGGPGTRLFMIFGSILIAGAGLLLWRRRRAF